MQSSHRESRTAPISRRVAALASCIAALWAAAPSLAQVKDVDPLRYVVVTQDDVYLRCGDGDVWYPVMKARRGAGLVVDGEGFGWLRVRYPEGAGAFVKASDVDLSADMRTATVTAPTKLLATNHHSGMDGSWKALLASPLGLGATLSVTEVLRDADGEVSGLRVVAPPSARAFVSEPLVRAASDEEIAAILGLETSEPANTTLAADPGVAAEGETGAGPAPEPTIAATTEAGGGLPGEAATGPITAPTTAPTTPMTSLTAPTAPAGVSSPLTPDPLALAPPASAPTRRETPAPAPVKPMTFDQLITAFQLVMGEAAETAEYAPLIEQHKRFIAKLGTSDAERYKARFLTQRVQLLEIKADFQESLKRVERASADAAEGASAIDRKYERYDAARPYPFVGTLVASALYDGERLPLLYRLQSIDGGRARTIAYILPSEKLDLRAKLGAVVGVEGEQREDPQLGVTVIDATRVDALERQAPATAAAGGGG